MAYYYFDLYKKDGEHQTTQLVFKEGGNTPYEVTERVTVLQLYDQDKGSVLRFLSSSKLAIESFLDGFGFGQRAEIIL
jgi:hypothetical protein